MSRQVDQLAAMAEAFGDETAFVDLGRATSLTFSAWESDANRLARGLVAIGVRTGDRVAIVIDAEHPLRWIVTYAAVHKAGAVAVPANTRLSARELGLILNHAEPIAALTTTTMLSTVTAASVSSLRSVITVDDENWAGLLDADGSRFQADVGDDDLADIMYTSGTTGLPKGIAVRHAGLHMMPNAEPTFSGQQWIHSSPMFTFAGIAFIYNPMKMGMSTLFLARFDAGTWLDEVERRRPTMAFLVPAMAQLLLGHDRFDSTDLSSLTVVSVGSAPLPPALHRRLADRLPDAAVTNNYSMTEAGTCYTYLPREEMERRPGSVGIPIGTEIRITDSDDQILGPDEVGEIQIKVGAKHREYYRNPEATAATWTGEWLRSGDLGFLDTDGYLYVSGRAKDVIIRGGNNIHAVDVESVLYEHDDIAEAAVAAVPHEVLGEDVGAWIVVRDGATLSAEAVVTFCRDRLADYKVPRVVTFVDSLPRNPTGKVLKQQLVR